MKFSVENNELIKALSVVSRAVTTKTTTSLLECVYIKTDGDRLVMEASDLEMSIITYLNADVIEEGDVLITLRTLFDLIRTYPDERVFFDINSDNYSINITCSQSEVTILGQNPFDYPVFEAADEGEFIVLANDVFKDMVRETVFAAAPQLSINPVLTGVNIKLQDGFISFVALDGYKMAIRKEMLPNAPEGVKSAIVPGRILSEILKIASLYTEDIRFAILPNRFVVNVGSSQIMSMLLEGPYINYEALIPAEINTVVKVNRNDMQVSIERASLLADANRNSLVKLIFDDEMLKLTSSSDMGRINEEVMINKTGDDVKIAFNVRFLVDVFKIIRDEKIIMEFKDSIGPCLIKPLDSDRFVYLVMPVRYTE